MRLRDETKIVKLGTAGNCAEKKCFNLVLARTRTTPDLDEVGKEIINAQDGNPDTRLAPNPGITAEQREAAQAAARRIRERASGRKTGPFDWEEWKAYRDEGRR